MFKQSTIDFNPGHPTSFIEDYLVSEGWKVEKILSYGGLSTVAIVKNKFKPDDQKKLCLKVFYGYYTVYNQIKSLSGHHLYAYKFYKELESHDFLFWENKFKNEANILSRIESPYWVKIVQKHLEREIPYYLMEYLPDGNLSSYILKIGSAQNRYRVPLEKAVSLMYHLLKGLLELHKLNIVHRDITPYNILISNNKPVWCDLGYARYKTEKESPSFKEPFFYWPPEHDFNFHEVDEKGDIYSLGVIFYRLLTGTLPRYDAPDVKELVPDVSPELNEFINRCIKYDQNSRFKSVYECLDELKKISYFNFS